MSKQDFLDRISLMEDVKTKIIQTLSRFLSEQGLEGVEPSLERPLEEKNGDYATNMAMVLAKKMSQSPREVAERIINLFNRDDFAKIEIAGPGFINFYLNDRDLVETLKDVIAGAQNYGLTKITDKKVVLEHTNANPNKALHLGHLRNACLGSAIEKILEAVGADVEVQYYVDDTGVQVAHTALGMKELSLDQKEGEKFDHFAARVYVETVQKMELSEDLKQKQAQIIEALDKHDGEIAAYVKDLAGKILLENLSTMRRFDIDYDLLVWESDIIGFGFWQKAFEVLRQSSEFIKSEEGKNSGCYVIKNVLGDDKVIVKSNGVVTYTGKDIAYHFWKFNLLGQDFKYKKCQNYPQEKDLYTTSREGEDSEKFGRADEVVNIIDVRQSFPQEAVKASLKALGYGQQSDQLRHIAYGVVNLSKKTAESLGVNVADNKNSYAMSGRQGIGIMADDLLDKTIAALEQKHPDSFNKEKIAAGAIKYNLLNYNPYSEIVFDLDSSLDINGNSGPYIQYAHARCSSILEKTAGREVEIDDSYALNEQELSLAKEIQYFPQIVKAAAETYAPNLICNYLFDLAKKFNAFYAVCPILNSSEEEFAVRLLLTRATRQVLKNGLSLLGIDAPDKM